MSAPAMMELLSPLSKPVNESIKSCRHLCVDQISGEGGRAGEISPFGPTKLQVRL
jgi:hypothetical protein